MKKSKRLLALCLACMLMLSAMAIPASAADTQDEYLTLNMYRTDYTRMRQKGNNTAIYIKNQEYTLPYNGYYVQTQYGATQTAGNIYAASYGPYRFNTYSPRVIRSNATSKNLTGYWVRIRGDYKDTTYDGGWVEIAWSPDTAGSYPSLN